MHLLLQEFASWRGVLLVCEKERHSIDHGLGLAANRDTSAANTAARIEVWMWVLISRQ